MELEKTTLHIFVSLCCSKKVERSVSFQGKDKSKVVRKWDILDTSLT